MSHYQRKLRYRKRKRNWGFTSFKTHTKERKYKKKRKYTIKQNYNLNELYITIILLHKPYMLTRYTHKIISSGHFLEHL